MQDYFTVTSRHSLSGSVSVDNLLQNLVIKPTLTIPSRVFVRRSVGGSSALFNGFITHSNGISSCVLVYVFLCRKINEAHIVSLLFLLSSSFVSSIYMCYVTLSP